MALVAQRIEHLTTDQKVGSSSLSERAGRKGWSRHISGRCHTSGVGSSRRKPTRCWLLWRRRGRWQRALVRSLASPVPGSYRCTWTATPRGRCGRTPHPHLQGIAAGGGAGAAPVGGRLGLLCCRSLQF